MLCDLMLHQSTCVFTQKKPHLQEKNMTYFKLTKLKYPAFLWKVRPWF